MSLTRRHLLAGTGALVAGAGLAGAAAARQTTDPHAHHRPAATPATPPAQPPARPSAGRVITPHGWTLPHRMVDGVKEFHLVAEEVEHEFAPGSRATVWGYNGSCPGPTIEATEGDRVRILVSNRLGEPTSVHWHGLLLPSGMDGVAGLTQPAIGPGETYAYEFTLRQHGTHLYHPHADEMVQMAMGMMGFFVVHPRDGEPEPIDRDYAVLLHNWALHPGTSRPDPAVMSDFDLWTMNAKVYPALAPLLAQTGERVRIRVANLSMWNHPIHLHGHVFEVTGGDGGRWPRTLWRPEVTEIVGVGQVRDLEFVAVPGDWAFHCHMSHHTMNAMGHDVPNPIGVDQAGVDARLRALLPGYMPMGRHGMAEHQDHVDMGHMQGPPNTLPMMAGQGPFGPIGMGGMFTVLKVRDRLPADGSDPGDFAHPPGTLAARVDADPDAAPRRPG